MGRWNVGRICFFVRWFFDQMDGCYYEHVVQIERDRCLRELLCRDGRESHLLPPTVDIHPKVVGDAHTAGDRHTAYFQAESLGDLDFREREPASGYLLPPVGQRPSGRLSVGTDKLHRKQELEKRLGLDGHLFVRSHQLKEPRFRKISRFGRRYHDRPQHAILRDGCLRQILFFFCDWLCASLLWLCRVWLAVFLRQCVESFQYLIQVLSLHHFPLGDVIAFNFSIRLLGATDQKEKRRAKAQRDPRQSKGVTTHGITCVFRERERGSVGATNYSAAATRTVRGKKATGGHET